MGIGLVETREPSQGSRAKTCHPTRGESCWIVCALVRMTKVEKSFEEAKKLFAWVKASYDKD
jgi:hypothetical protein